MNRVSWRAFVPPPKPRDRRSSCWRLGAVTLGRGGEQLAALGELADAGVVGFSDDGSPVRSASILRNALAYAGALGLPIVEHAEEPSLTDGAEANDGFVATVLGLRGWPAAAEEMAVARDIAILADVLRDVRGAHLHLTHLSTAVSLELVRRAKAAPASASSPSAASCSPPARDVTAPMREQLGDPETELRRQPDVQDARLVERRRRVRASRRPS